MERKKRGNPYGIDYAEKRGRLGQYAGLVRKEGFLAATSRSLGYIERWSAAPFVHRYIRRHRFSFEGADLSFWPSINERAVEVPIAMAFVQGSALEQSRILEVGNVLANYVRFPHDVIDKYELAEAVQNVDVVDLKPLDPYDLIVSISTLEHVGFDEPVASPGKVRTAILNLYNRCLQAPGRMLLTMPLGYNPEVDEMIEGGHLSLGEVRFLRRESRWNIWREVEINDVRVDGRFLEHGSKYANAHAIVVWKFEKTLDRA